MNYKKLLTIIVPCYNEINTIQKIIKKINEQKFSKQIILIDDYSHDGTRELIKKKLIKKVDKIIFHNKNLGKGACIKNAKKYSIGKIIIIQDADLEYSPKDYKKLINPILKNKTNIVYGSRVMNKSRYRSKNFSSKFRIFANHFLTIISNYLNDQNLTDAHTCYKVFRRNIFNKIKLEEDHFSFCPEITTKISMMKENIIEVPISYKGRGYKEGKKINFYDGLEALKTLIKYRYFK